MLSGNADPESAMALWHSGTWALRHSLIAGT